MSTEAAARAPVGHGEGHLGGGGEGIVRARGEKGAWGRVKGQ